MRKNGGALIGAFNLVEQWENWFTKEKLKKLSKFASSSWADEAINLSSPPFGQIKQFCSWQSSSNRCEASVNWEKTKVEKSRQTERRLYAFFW